MADPHRIALQCRSETNARHIAPGVGGSIAGPEWRPARRKCSPYNAITAAGVGKVQRAPGAETSKLGGYSSLLFLLGARAALARELSLSSAAGRTFLFVATSMSARAGLKGQTWYKFHANALVHLLGPNEIASTRRLDVIAIHVRDTAPKSYSLQGVAKVRVSFYFSSVLISARG